MPVSKEFRSMFRSAYWRKQVRPRIFRRAGERCETCRVPRDTEVWRWKGCWLSESVSWNEGVSLSWKGEDGASIDIPPESDRRLVRIVLSVVLLDHDPKNHADENLKALCQWCQLKYDREHHAKSRGIRKDKRRPIVELGKPGIPVDRVEYS